MHLFVTEAFELLTIFMFEKTYENTNVIEKVFFLPRENDAKTQIGYF